MTYRAPLADIRFAVAHMTGLGEDAPLGADDIDAILEEAGRIATDVIAPLNRVGDTVGAKKTADGVAMPKGWHEAYRRWIEAGWNGLSAPEDHGGQGLPMLVNAACVEMWNGAAMAFGLGPVLTMGAIEAIAAHGDTALKDRVLAKLISGEWMGTMNLTEPQAGSDLNAVKARAERNADGTYRVFGQKIFITYGEHDLTDNIIHLVLARLPDAPPGTRGISLFAVPKRMIGADGAPGEANDVRCHAIEHKLGIHGSPTCTMIFGDNGGAVGWLIGEENRGLACMFTMMNNARLCVGLQGVGIAEHAYQDALRYARERRQGKGPGGAKGPGMDPIIVHPDVQRMLLTMAAYTQAARGICYALAAAIDRGHADGDTARAGLLTPVAKAFATDIGIEVASIGIQVHGGMGYIEETGAAQHLRDARIAAIYEGTNGIQAIDLVTRKLPLNGGETVKAYLAELRAETAKVAAANDPAFGATAERLTEALDALETATAALQAMLGADPAAALAGATPYCRLFGTAMGGVLLAKGALAAGRAGDHDASQRIALARFYAENIAPQAGGLARSVTDGAASLAAAARILAA